jgi:exonuclease VII large subunit
MQEGRHKKKLNAWQENRERLNHQMFQNRFYALLARPRVITALDGLSTENATNLEASVIAAFEHWPALERDFIVLLARANPCAIATPELQLAFVTPTRSDSKAICRQYALRYENEVERRLTRPRQLLRTITDIVAEVQMARAGREQPRPIRLGTQLQIACAEFTRSVSELADIADIGSCDV